MGSNLLQSALRTPLRFLPIPFSFSVVLYDCCFVLFESGRLIAQAGFEFLILHLPSARIAGRTRALSWPVFLG